MGRLMGVRNVVLGLCALWFAACAGAQAPVQAAPANVGPAPLRVVCFFDHSKSTLKSGVAQPLPADFEALLSLVEVRGGELAVGVIGAQSNTSLLRVELAQAPLPEAVKPPGVGNAFQREKEGARYKAAKLRDEDRYRTWKGENRVRVERFRALLSPILGDSVSAMKSDILGAVRRAAMFLGEPPVGWRKKPQLFAIFVTDGIDNVGAGRADLPAGTNLVLVAGYRGAGALAYLGPVCMESFGAAVRYLANSVKEKGD